MTPIRLSSSQQPLQLTVFGFTIDQPPPMLTEFDVFPESPSASIDLATSSTQVIPSQTIRLSSKQAIASFDNPGQPGDVQLAFQSADGASFDSENERVELPPGAEVKLSLNLDSPVNFSFNAEIAALGSNQLITIEVNGTHIVTQQPDSNEEWHWLSFSVPASFLVPKLNTLKIYSPEENELGLWVANAQVSSEDIPIQASYHWATVVQGSLAPGSSLSQSTSYTTGVTETETDSFTEQIGVQAGGDVYGSLSAQLSFSFSATETHSIATTESKTETTTITLSGSPDKSVSYQVWQLVIRFATVSGPYIDQLIDTAIAPLISTEASSDN
jgi:hypothetical protein